MADGKELIKADQQSNAPAQVPQGTNLTRLSMANIANVAKAMALSGMFPDIAKDSAKAYVKILAGQEMGVAPFEAMSGISIIAGKATIGGNIMAAKVKASGKYDYRIKKREKDGCTIEFFEKNPETGKRESLGTETFDADDARAAGLLNKDMWKKYPRNMYFNRAISNGVRTYCPDVLGAGPVYTPEEMGAAVDENGEAIIEPGITYSQDKPADQPKEPPRKQIESNHNGAVDGEVVDKPVQTVENDQANAESTSEGVIDRNDPSVNPLQLISDHLGQRGVKDKAERGRMALRIANIGGFGDLNRHQWFEVFDSIVEMDNESLIQFRDDAQETPETEDLGDDGTITDNEREQLNNQVDEVTTVTDDDINAADQGTLLDNIEDTFGAGAEDITPKPSQSMDPPTPKKKPASKKPTGRQLAKVSSLYVKKKLKTDEEKQAFNNEAIGKNFPTTAEDYDNLITALER